MPLIRKNGPESDAREGGAKPDVRASLTDGDQDQRWMAARALGDRPDDADALGDALARETDGRVREAILNSLVRIGGARGVGAVLPWLRSDDAGLRTGALDALKAMAGAATAAAPQLADLLHDPDPDVRLLACEVVRELPTAQASALLCALLEDEPEVNVCGAAVEALADVAGPEARPVLARCAARFAHEPFLLFAIGAASSRIGSTQGDAGR
jgi:HEAT repeat protein